MAGRIKFPFSARILLMLLAFCWILVGIFMVFQYQREKEYRTHMMDTRLQMHNSRIIEDMRRGENIASVVRRIEAPVENLRVSLIDRSGKVIYDSRDQLPESNHNNRQEIVSARLQGDGYALERVSESDDRHYFYSATLGDNGMVVRSAAPYTHTLTEFLRADRSIIWIMAVVTLVMSLFAYLVTRKISVSIRRLTLFAEKAQKGERIYSGYSFPHDELGSIANNIVKLYVQRDATHREAMRLEHDRARLKKQLTNNINHELKTPVSSILVSLDLLHDHPELPDEKKRELFERIRQNANRLNALLKDVSTITRMDEGRSMIEKKPIDLKALVSELVEDARSRTEMQISLDMPEITVMGDRSLLESVFRNLLDNAIAYSGGTEITINADRQGNFRFSDNGCGIPSEHLPHIFERFYRIDSGRSRASGGTGLGLSIVRNAVAIHGGSISASNTPGLTFCFRLAPMNT